MEVAFAARPPVPVAGGPLPASRTPRPAAASSQLPSNPGGALRVQRFVKEAGHGIGGRGGLPFLLLPAAVRLLCSRAPRRGARGKRTGVIAVAAGAGQQPNAAARLRRRELLPAVALPSASAVAGAAASAALAPVLSPSPARAATSDLQLGKLVVGAWAWGDRLFWGYNESQDADIREGFNTCVNGGVSFFDTAEIYGPGRSEELLGKFIRESGADAKVATKFAAFPWKLDRSDVVKACKGSLERLGMQSIDLYQIHFPSIWRNEALWDGLADCYDQGLVKAVGVSNYGSAGLRAIHAALAARGVPLATNQIQYSLIYRFPELNGMKATCDELGVKVLAYSPLALGLLAGKASLDRLPDGPRAQIYTKVLQDPGWAGLDATMREVAKAHGPDADPAQVALAWCIAKGTVPIAGVRNARQAESDVKATKLGLSEGEVAALDAAAAKVAPYISPEESPFKQLRVSLDTKQELYEA